MLELSQIFKINNLCQNNNYRLYIQIPTQNVQFSKSVKVWERF
jgi:hypothetical protein